ncbi:hypothetical protein CHUAL_009814 [Chamberlinius hualienensis]
MFKLSTAIYFLFILACFAFSCCLGTPSLFDYFPRVDRRFYRRKRRFLGYVDPIDSYRQLRQELSVGSRISEMKVVHIDNRQWVFLLCDEIAKGYFNTSIVNRHRPVEFEPFRHASKGGFMFKEGGEWNRVRAYISRSFLNENADKFIPRLTKHVEEMLARMEIDPHVDTGLDIIPHISKCVNAMLFEMLLGTNISENRSPFGLEIFDAVTTLNELLPERHGCSWFSIFSLNGIRWNKAARKLRSFIKMRIGVRCQEIKAYMDRDVTATYERHRLENETTLIDALIIQMYEQARWKKPFGARLSSASAVTNVTTVTTLSDDDSNIVETHPAPSEAGSVSSSRESEDIAQKNESEKKQSEVDATTVTSDHQLESRTTNETKAIAALSETSDDEVAIAPNKIEAITNPSEANTSPSERTLLPNEHFEPETTSASSASEVLLPLNKLDYLPPGSEAVTASSKISDFMQPIKGASSRHENDGLTQEPEVNVAVCPSGCETLQQTKTTKSEPQPSSSKTPQRVGEGRCPYSATNTMFDEPQPGSSRTFFQRVSDGRDSFSAAIPDATSDAGLTGFNDLLNITNDDIDLDPEIIKQEIMSFLLGGHMSTVLAITWTILNLTREVEHQDIVREEVYALFGDKISPEYAAERFKHMPRLDNVIKEAMRMHPPIPMHVRRLKEDTRILGSTIPKRCLVAVPTPVIHYDREVYDYPNQFIPERWETSTKDEKNKSDDFLNIPPHLKYSFLPFSEGPRQCPGSYIGMMVTRFVVAHFLHRFFAERNPNQPFQVTGDTFTMPVNNYHIVLHRAKP